MKRVYIPLAVVLIAATGAYAQTSPNRADVKAETRAANARGELPVGEHEDVTPKKSNSTLTRAERKAETRALAAQGKLPVGESYSPDVSSSKKSGVDRRSVRSEAAAANKAGTLLKPGD